MFDNLVEVPEKVTVSRAKKNHTKVEIGAELDDLAALRLLEKALKGVSDQIGSAVKTQVAAIFGREMFQTKRKPDTLIGFGERALAYLIPSKKSTASNLDEQTLGILEELGAPVEVLESQPERIILNPRLVDDPVLLELVSEVLQSDKRTRHLDIFQKQPSRSKTVVTEETISVAAKNVQSEEEAADLIGRLMTISVGRFKLDGETDSAKVIQSALEIVGKIGILGKPKATKKATVKK